MPNSKLHCPKCGAEASEGDAYCMECGNELTQRFEGAQPDERQPPPPPSTEPMAGWKKFVLIVCSIFIFPVGLVWGLVYLVSKVNPDRKRMGKWAVGISALMLVIVVVTPDSEQSDTGPAMVQPVAGGPPITIMQLQKEFDDNPFAAKKKYGGQRYRITGNIRDIGCDEWSLFNPYVFLVTGDPSCIVRCGFSPDEEDALAALSKGVQVTIEGDLGGDVTAWVLWNSQVVDE